MKAAIFSDVQGNRPALEAAIAHIEAWRPDLVVMAGDLINRGPRNRECLLRFEELQAVAGWLPLRGNHESWVLRCGREPPADPLEADLRRFADFTHAQIADCSQRLAGWPDHLCFAAPGGGHWVHVTHGTLAGNRDGISSRVADADLSAKLPEDLALFVTAHTHKPLTRRFRETAILNVGSVGSPFDGDPRASYGQIQFDHRGWRTRIVRLGYDRAAADRDFRDSGFLEGGGPLARILYQEWRRARLLLPHWQQRYQEAVRRGAIRLEQSVADFLDSLPPETAV